jgi:signal transduction histidine kinase
MNVLRRLIEAIKATLNRLPITRRATSQGKHALVFQRLFWGALAGCLMAVFFGDSPLLENMELSMLEWRYRTADQLALKGEPIQATSKDIAVVAFDDTSQFDLGFPRFNDYQSQGVLADVLETIENGAPTVVAVDLDLRGGANLKLIRLFRRYRNVVLAVFGSLEGNSDLPDAEFMKHAVGYGYDELARESNGTVMRLPVDAANPVLDPDETSSLTKVPSLTQAIMDVYRAKTGIGSTDLIHNITPDQPIYINFKRINYPTYSMSAILDPTFDPTVFRDKIVIIAPALTAKHADASHVITPLRKLTPEVFVHADAVQTLINNDVISSFPKGIAHHLLILLGATFGAVSSVLQMGRRALFMVCGGIFLIVVAQLGFQLWHVALPVVAPLAMLVSGFILGTVIYLDTDLRQRNRELAAAREHMQIRAEEERKRIAGDLHDETLPALSSVARMIDELFRVDDINTSTVPERMRMKLDATIQEMRRVINDLHPSVLETMGFVPALENLAVQLSHDTGIDYTFVDRNDQSDYDLTDFATLQLYRIVQEALNNVGKHSSGSQVDVRLQTHDGNLEIQITDNGKGINPKLIRKDSHGLLNIRHRAQLIGATVEWKKAEVFETGTQFKVKMPLVVPEPANGNTTESPAPSNVIDMAQAQSNIELKTQKGTEQA